MTFDADRIKASAAPAQLMRWLPTGSKLFASVGIDCGAPGLTKLQTAEVTLPVLLAIGNDVFVMPVSASGVRVRDVER